MGKITVIDQTHSLTASEWSVADLRNQMVGLEQQVPLIDGSMRQYVYLDNAASTPSFQGVQERVNEALLWYSSVHRGSGFKSLLSTHAYDRAREVVMAFVGGNADTDVVVFGKNTSEVINIVASCGNWQPGDVVIATLMEHHSNDLPWRAVAQVEYAGVDDCGCFDLNDLEDKLKRYAGRVKMVACTGASNVTGFTPPIHAVAALAHRYGALMLADCAQLAPHRAVDMGAPGTPGHLDFVTLSAHKMYAPFGAGAVVGPRAYFEQKDPAFRGGGTIEIVTLDEVYWAGSPDRNEPGSPNVIGAVAMAASLKILSAVGMDAIAQHEKELTTYALERIQRVPGLRLFGSCDPARVEDRVGVIPFVMDGIPHGKVAAVLSFEGGIGVRNGCFCAHPYLLHLMGIDEAAFERFKNQVLHNDRSERPGMVRASFGCYTSFDEIDHLVTMLERLSAGDIQGTYAVETVSGSYYPQGYDPAVLSSYFEL
jgi:selenocysteine lyase/cysteine desulfurase